MMIHNVDVDLEERGEGNVTFQVENVPEMFLDSELLVHRGALMTYLDIATTIALYGFEKKGRL